ncbi:MAG: TraB/GumN family protein [Chitinophagaceae bacterium]
MKRISAAVLMSLVTLAAFSQQNGKENTLLWKISGPGLDKPSYLFGTIHMLCAEDAVLSGTLKDIIRESDEVYFEVDMDNLFEMAGAMGKMKMRGDTTLRDLLSDTDYQKVKEYFVQKGSMLPFSILETFKPMLAASTLQEGSMPCEQTAMMEQVIMQEAKEHDKTIRGLETMAFQAGVLDSIPYSLQARQLVNFIDSAATGGGDVKAMEEMFSAYRNQDLQKLEELMVETDAAMAAFTDIMLYHRNQNWVRKLQDMLPGKSLLIAVGAGHLPGPKGMIQLLRQAGYLVTPVDNKTRSMKVI